MTTPRDAQAVGQLEELARLIANNLAERLEINRHQLLTRGQLAARLQISERSVAILVARGELPAPVRLGGCVRWDWRDVSKILVSNRDRCRRTRRRKFLAAQTLDLAQPEVSASTNETSHA